MSPSPHPQVDLRLIRVLVGLVRVPVGLVRVLVGLVRVPVGLVRVLVGLVRVPVGLVAEVGDLGLEGEVPVPGLRLSVDSLEELVRV